MVYGYSRVSTKGQERDGNSLEVQEKMLRENGAELIYSDSFTGTKKHRPELDKLMYQLAYGDTLIVTKLDRIARSTIHGAQLVEELLSRGVKLNILNIGVMDNTPSSKLIRNVFFAFAEFERDMIVERTQEGKAIAKTKNDFKEGRPRKFTKKQIEMALELLGKHSYNEVAKMTNISVSTITRAARKRKAGGLK